METGFAATGIQLHGFDAVRWYLLDAFRGDALGGLVLELDAELGGFDVLCWLRGLEGGGGKLGMVREEAGKRMHFVA
jgi:hypothetical protein